MANQERLTSEKINEEKKDEPLSIDDIKSYAEELKKKVEEAKVQKEKDIEKNLTDREVLFEEAQRIAKLLKEARQIRKNIIPLVEELGDSSDPEAREKFNKIESSISGLEKEQKEVNKKIGAIEDQPEVLNKLHEIAGQEDAEITKKKIVEETNRLFNSRIDELAKEINVLAAKKKSLKQQEKDWVKESSSFKDKIGTEIRKTARTFEGSELETILRNIETESKSIEEIREKLFKVKKSLRIFKIKERKEINSLLFEIEKFEKGSANALSARKKNLEAVEAGKRNLFGKYRDIILEAWQKEDEVKSIGQMPLPLKLFERLHGKVEEFAGVRHLYEGQHLGVYKGWYDAKSAPENKELADIYEDIEEGGRSLAGKDPSKN